MKKILVAINAILNKRVFLSVFHVHDMLKEEAANSLSYCEKEKSPYSGGVPCSAPDVEEGFAIGQGNQGTGNPAEKRKAGSNLYKYKLFLSLFHLGEGSCGTEVVSQALAAMSYMFTEFWGQKAICHIVRHAKRHKWVTFLCQHLN